MLVLDKPDEARLLTFGRAEMACSWSRESAVCQRERAAVAAVIRLLASLLTGVGVMVGVVDVFVVAGVAVVELPCTTTKGQEGGRWGCHVLCAAC